MLCIVAAVKRLPVHHPNCRLYHQGNMSVCFIPPYTPLLYGKTGVYRGMHYCLNFALKHGLWVLVRTASVRRFQRVPTINVLSKNKKKIKFFYLKITIFTTVKYCSILHGHVCVMFTFWFFEIREDIQSNRKLITG